MSAVPVSHDPATYTPPAKYNRSDGATCCPHAAPVAPGSCEFCWELHRDACEPCWERHLASMTETDHAEENPMSTPADGLALADVRRELAHLVALADTAVRPKPDVINPPGHAMPGHEWRVAQEVPLGVRPPLWVVRSVDEAESCDGVFVAQPDPYVTYDWEQQLDFVAMRPVDARRLAMALLAAADRASHHAYGIPRLEDRRKAQP
ncbi:hypothetical protein [Streptomyces sp. V1I6]|uniref:hypothetical protein n=1 Tax=Streptomyces sp. V1I6 TaxID=3042273 RepID=UPI00278B982B|nr:hypothetical protein [Streptomyces sp. V1I6]MDQ0842437.1 hypothetical protein [Streptomyces sp. V1I6]